MDPCKATPAQAGESWPWRHAGRTAPLNAASRESWSGCAANAPSHQCTPPHAKRSFRVACDELVSSELFFVCRISRRYPVYYSNNATESAPCGDGYGDAKGLGEREQTTLTLETAAVAPKGVSRIQRDDKEGRINQLNRTYATASARPYLRC